MTNQAQAKRGKFLEAKVRKAGRLLVKQKPGYFYRFPDTYETDSPIGPTPGDFMLLTRKGKYLIECKESVEHESLSEDLDAFLVDTQVANARLWKRMHGEPFYLFLDRRAQIVEIWDAMLVNEQWLLPRKKRTLTPHQRIMYCTLKNLQETMNLLFF